MFVNNSMNEEIVFYNSVPFIQENSESSIMRYM